MDNNKLLNYFSKGIIAITTIILMSIIFIILKESIFSSNANFISYIRSFGAFSAIIFVILQILQVVFPIIPGGASCLVGVILFGPLKGFLYNYIGLTIGSVIAFDLSKQYGLSIIRKIFSKKTLLKYENYLNSNNHFKIFIWGILLPGAPDDLLCYLIGLTNLTYQKFITVILTCKMPTLLVYSIVWYYFPNIINLLT